MAGRDDNNIMLESANHWAHQVIGAAIEVHRQLGPGLPEKIYESALCLELENRSIPYRRQALVEVRYKGVPVGQGTIDILVAEQLVVELKAVDTFAEAHRAQVLTYLKITGLPLGLLINFGVSRLKNGGIRRIILTP